MYKPIRHAYGTDKAPDRQRIHAICSYIRRRRYLREEDEFATFEVGKTYYDTSACDHNCIFTITVLKRTDKTLTYEQNGKTRRSKIRTDENGEYVMPDNYSMAPIFRASCEYL